mmetsp:Transcript_25116/g.54651  ORF Transcript_25116/g.54651 Transcript_25116/m.54651 type:complete len:459 (+) Transcript_25116:188-1564(+)
MQEPPVALALHSVYDDVLDPPCALLLCRLFRLLLLLDGREPERHVPHVDPHLVLGFLGPRRQLRPQVEVDAAVLHRADRTRGESVEAGVALARVHRHLHVAALAPLVALAVAQDPVGDAVVVAVRVEPDRHHVVRPLLALLALRRARLRLGVHAAVVELEVVAGEVERHRRRAHGHRLFEVVLALGDLLVRVDVRRLELHVVGERDVARALLALVRAGVALNLREPVGHDPLEGGLHVSGGAPPHPPVTVNLCLVAQLDELAEHDGIQRLNHGRCGVCPVGSALSLVPDSRNNAVLTPINLGRVLDISQLVGALRMPGDSAGERVELFIDGYVRGRQRRQTLVVIVTHVGVLVKRKLVRQVLLVVLSHQLHVLVKIAEAFLPLLAIPGVLLIVIGHKLVENRTRIFFLQQLRILKRGVLNERLAGHNQHTRYHRKTRFPYRHGSQTSHDATRIRLVTF